MFLFVRAGTLLSISGFSLCILSINPRGTSVERYRRELLEIFSAQSIVQSFFTMDLSVMPCFGP